MMMMGIFAAEDPCRVRRTNPCRGDGRAKSFERCLLGAPGPDPIVFASAKMMIMSRMIPIVEEQDEIYKTAQK